MIRNLLVFCVLMIVASCTERVSRNENPKILVMGDSMMAAHGSSKRAVADAIEKALEQPVIDRSVMGARVIYSLPISGSIGFKIGKQYTQGNWDWVVLNGGGNDLWFGCGCNGCDKKIGKLASEDGKNGAIPQLVGDLRSTGARVVYVGYLRSPGVFSPIEHCKDEGEKLEARLKVMAEQDDGVYFLSLADLVPNGDRSFHGVDMIHPSIKASAVIGARVAKIMVAQ